MRLKNRDLLAGEGEAREEKCKVARVTGGRRTTGSLAIEECGCEKAVKMVYK
jgi:hypothetical protein